MLYKIIAVYILGYLINYSIGYQLYLGKCPVFLREPCDPSYIRFLLTTGDSPLQEIKPINLKLPSTFNKKKPVKIIIHGYGGLINDTVTPSVTKAYKKMDYNVIVVDWEHLSILPCYPMAALNTYHIGQCTALMAVSLAAHGILPKDLHVIGFSLGAHIAGFASNNLMSVLGTRFGRITGLDPALPLFNTYNSALKLDPSDADFVDVIHTSAGTYGKMESVGHVDFYVNGGSYQPACAINQYPATVSRHAVLCSHRMSGQYFAESVTEPTPFLGVQCRNIAMYMMGFCRRTKNAYLAKMGENCNRRSRGKFFVNTRDTPPFALG